MFIKRRFFLHVTIFALMITALLASCATEGFVEDTARERSHELTMKAYREAYQRNEPDWDRVIKLSTKAIKADTSYPLPYSLRGAAYNAKGQYSIAVTDLDTSLELSSDFSPSFVNRGISYMHLELYDLALLDFESALELEPDNITSLVNIAQIFTMEGDVTLACRFLEKAVIMGFNDLTHIYAEPAFMPLSISRCFEDIEKMMSGY